MTVMSKELTWFAGEVTRLAAVIGAPPGPLPTYGRTADFARPHIEFGGAQWHYVVVERGEELERNSSADAQEILCCVFEGVTFSMACDDELRHRRRGQDPRRQLFDVQLGLLGQLSPDWQRRTRARL
ncbi:hypothetical protein BH10PLA1_BH10PLA1_20790 [soil metagenome]